jgi:hypothetical protein
MTEPDDRASRDDQAEDEHPADSSGTQAAEQTTRWKAVTEEERAGLRAHAEEDDDDPLGPGPETALYLQ